MSKAKIAYQPCGAGAENLAGIWRRGVDLPIDDIYDLGSKVETTRPEPETRTMKRKKPLVLSARIREHSNFIEDQDGNQVSIDEARLLWESGQVTNCDYVFKRLATQFNWDFTELVRWYDERLPPELDKPIVAVQLRLTPEERDRLRVKAAQVGKQMSGYVRDLVMADLDGAPNGKKTTKKS